MLIKRLAYLPLRRSLRFERMIHLNAAQVYTMVAFAPTGIDRELLLAAKSELQHLTSRPLVDRSWDELRQLCADLRMTI
jgi:hypothetical protein